MARLRIRMTGKRPPVSSRPLPLTLLFAELLRPLALVALGFAAWRIAYQLGLVSPFVFEDGPLARWQLWAILALLLESTSWFLRQLRGKGDHAVS